MELSIKNSYKMHITQNDICWEVYLWKKILILNLARNFFFFQNYLLCMVQFCIFLFKIMSQNFKRFIETQYFYNKRVLIWNFINKIYRERTKFQFSSARLSANLKDNLPFSSIFRKQYPWNTNITGMLLQWQNFLLYTKSNCLKPKSNDSLSVLEIWLPRKAEQIPTILVGRYTRKPNKGLFMSRSNKI